MKTDRKEDCVVLIKRGAMRDLLTMINIKEVTKKKKKELKMGGRGIT
jgi:hypothetical protein